MQYTVILGNMRWLGSQLVGVNRSTGKPRDLNFWKALPYPLTTTIFKQFEFQYGKKTLYFTLVNTLKGDLSMFQWRDYLTIKVGLFKL
jgi:hypothetical protein